MCSRWTQDSMGNVFTRTFGTGQVSELAEKSMCFYNLWRLCNHFDVNLIVNKDHNVSLVREGDKALMECFIDLDAYTSAKLVTLGRYRKFYGMYWLSEVLCSNGCAVDPTVLEYRRYEGSRQLAYKQPRRVDLNL